MLLADVTMSPSSSGMPGANFAQLLINWLGQIALWGSLAAMLIGAAIYGIAQHSGNYNGGFRGRQVALGGLIGACLTGLAPQAINLLWKAAGA